MNRNMRFADDPYDSDSDGIELVAVCGDKG